LFNKVFAGGKMAAKNYTIKCSASKIGKILIFGIIVIFIHDFFQRESK